MAQAILDLFPDAVSQFGLVGCGFAVVIAVLFTLVAVLGLLTSLDPP